MRIMICASNSAVQRRYARRIWLSALLCVLGSLAAAAFFRLLHHPSPWMGYPVAVLPALPILWALIATGIYLKEETDEFQRDVFLQALLVGTFFTLSLVTASAYLKDFAGAPALPLVWVYPLFWIFTGLGYAVVWRRYK